ncbi:UDP-glycosyltransferase 74F2 [Linum perenne]
MTNQQQQQQPHCLVIPIPSTGHINPMLQFSKRLIHKGIKVTLVLTRFLSNSITSTATTSGINLAAISDGYDDGGMDAAPNPGVYLRTFREVGSKALAQLITEISEAGDPVQCVVYNHCIPWCLDVAKRFGLVGAVFLTQSCAVDSVYKLVHGGLIKPPVNEEDGVLRFDGLPALTVGDLPSFVSNFGSYPAVFDVLVGQFDNMGDADWVLCNSVYELEHEAADWLSKKVPNFTTIGPTIPSTYLDKQLQDDVDYGFNMFKPINEPIKNWLATKPNNSVVYISFGSLATLTPTQMEELYHGLDNSGHYFLWVVRKTEEDKLPQQSLTPKKGLIVSWCPQLKVLASPAVGCFMTHCGWNSTLEALSLGVPMVAMPQWTDQSTNAKFIRDVWKVGVKVESGDDGLVTREEVERCVKEVMEGDKGEEMRMNGEKLRVLMKDAASEGGSSDGNILRFVGSLIRPDL